MITKITLNNVTSFKQQTSLTTNKKINLIYGLNGTGKSTFSNYLYQCNDIDFSSCFMEPQINTDEIDMLVYNQTFVKDNFYESKNLKGIFSLSGENKKAQDQIDLAQSKIDKLEIDENEACAIIKTTKDEKNEKYNEVLNKIWEVKRTYTGGDRVLSYCLEGLSNSKEKLYDYLVKIPVSTAPLPKTIEQIKAEVQSLTNVTTQIITTTISLITFSELKIEKDPIFQKIIMGNIESSLAAVIDKLKNSDWVKEGIVFLSETDENESGLCPFCQQHTITKDFLNNLNKYFNIEYQNDIGYLKKLEVSYYDAILNLPQIDAFNTIDILSDLNKEFITAYQIFRDSLNNNLNNIREKLKFPSAIISLRDSSIPMEKINKIIENANILIDEFNNKIKNKNQFLRELEEQFWQMQRWEYKQVISSYKEEEEKYELKIKIHSQKIDEIKKEISTQKIIILLEQKNIVNIDSAINNINTNLLQLGIDDFKIEKHSDDLYKISRVSQNNEVFKSLSEGEKMVISFLYFIELCKGKRTATDTRKKKIVAIDDPISSLSHIFVFNIGQIIKQEFFSNDNNYEQIFILTHSLYFFHELFTLAKPKSGSPEEKREKTPLRFRINKNTNGSHFTEITGNDIQNDYQAYWKVITDRSQPPALIANCMRNIIEYFFGFVENIDLNNVFQKPPLNTNKFRAFNQYMNTESHSKPHHIFDFKEFDYDIFRDAFCMVFKVTNYEKHYDKMIEE